ncbi:MAG: cyclase family protein [Pseudomonadota bacterium]
MNIIDLTHPIHGGMPVYPGSSGPSIRRVATLARDGFAEKRVTLSTHTGTHVDAPAHMISGAATLDAWPMERFAGPALVIRPENHGGVIDLKSLKPLEKEISCSEFLLFNTGWSRFWGSPSYDQGYPVLSTEAAVWICGFRLKGVGFDTLSADRVDTIEYPVHHTLLSRNIMIIENLANLEAISEKRIFFCCFPLSFKESDGSPVRAAGFFDPPG